MSTLKCALMGLPPPEVESFQTFFKLTASLGVSFMHTPHQSEADIFIVDASDTAAVNHIRHPAFNAKALLVGDSVPDSRWPVLSRPFRLTKVLQILQELGADTSKPAYSQMAPAARIVQERPKGNVALVIDDSEIAQKATRMKLERFGVGVKSAASGEEALLMLRDHAFAIVFIDVMMEGLDGYQTCKLIKQRKYAGGQSPAAVMLTSRGGTIDKIRGSLAGCDAYLTKPVDDQDLMRVLVKQQVIVQPTALSLLNPLRNLS